MRKLRYAVAIGMLCAATNACSGNLTGPTTGLPDYVKMGQWEALHIHEMCVIRLGQTMLVPLNTETATDVVVAISFCNPSE